MNTVRMDTLLRDPNTTTPSLILDFSIVQNTYNHFLDSFPGGQVFYAMKANANPQIVRLVVENGGSLEIASLAELERALDAGATGERIICSNPIKNPVFLQRMHEENVYAVVVDSTYELEKVALYMPGCRVYARLAVDNHGSVLPLAGKFGVNGDEAMSLLNEARDLGLNPIGLSFHVGSQCLRVSNWVSAIRTCGEIWRQATENGHEFYLLDIGGGFPAGHYHDPNIPSLDEIGIAVMQAIHDHIPHPNPMLVMEPGRGLVGESGILVATVVGKARRGMDEWLYLDAGVFNGLMETYEGFPPVAHHLSSDVIERSKMSYTLAGPSCDSCDVIARGYQLPETHIGDRLVFYDAGAYTNEYAVAFNGFPIPKVIELERGLELV
jgi:ornithine decarboxylase